MKVVTSGSRYLDIDAYAGCIAYAELLNQQGIPAVFATTAPLNESITPSIRAWPVTVERSYQSNVEDRYIIIDLSEPKFFDTFVDLDRVDEVIDHHLDSQDYWRDKSHVHTQIEYVGAACTLVYERWRDAELLSKITKTSARLLAAGILDNTLNFKASVTDGRDREAYDALMEYADLSADWPGEYFTECQGAIENDLERAIHNDTKTVNYPQLDAALQVAQLVVWDGSKILNHQLALAEYMNADKKWFINIVSISDDRSYFVTEDLDVQEYLTSLLNISFNQGYGVADHLWLRKEIMKRAMDAAR